VTAELSARGVYAVAGHDGPWHYVGQATYVDDDGHVIEHDYVRMVQDGDELWVPLADVTAREVAPMPLHMLADEHAA
jgi:hypothetical protein